MARIFIAELLLNVIKALLLVASAVHLLQMTQSIAFFGLAMVLEVVSSIFAPMYIGTLIDKYGAIFYYYKTLLIVFILAVF